MKITTPVLDSPAAIRLGASEILIIRAVQALGSQQAYGAAIQRYLRSFGRAVSLGQIATTLERLEAKGLVTSALSTPEPVRGGRAKRIFTLEERGVRALEHAVTSHAMLFGDNSGAPHGNAADEEKAAAV